MSPLDVYIGPWRINASSEQAHRWHDDVSTES